MPSSTPTASLEHVVPENVITRCLVVLIGVMATGTVGFVLIEDWDVWQSLYFTLITITTVGYGDEGISQAGKVFAAFLVLGGIGVATYSLTQLVQAAVSYQFAWRSKMQKDIDRLTDHVIVCGFGRMGQAVAEQLRDGHVPCVLIEPANDAYDRAIEQGFLAIHGMASNDEVLQRAGGTRARSIVCVANCDAENVFITLSGRVLNPEAVIISRADANDTVHKLRQAGATRVISPHQMAGAQVATTILCPHMSDLFDTTHDSTSGIRLSEIQIDDGSKLAGQTVREFGAQEPTLTFVAIKRRDGDTIIKPRGDATFEPGDIVIVAGEADHIASMRQHSLAAELVS